MARTFLEGESMETAARQSQQFDLLREAIIERCRRGGASVARGIHGVLS